MKNVIAFVAAVTFASAAFAQAEVPVANTNVYQKVAEGAAPAPAAPAENVAVKKHKAKAAKKAGKKAGAKKAPKKAGKVKVAPSSEPAAAPAAEPAAQ